MLERLSQRVGAAPDENPEGLNRLLQPLDQQQSAFTRVLLEGFFPVCLRGLVLIHVSVAGYLHLDRW